MKFHLLPDCPTEMHIGVTRLQNVGPPAVTDGLSAQPDHHPPIADHAPGGTPNCASPGSETAGAQLVDGIAVSRAAQVWTACGSAQARDHAGFVEQCLERGAL